MTKDITFIRTTEDRKEDIMETIQMDCTKYFEDYLEGQGIRTEYTDGSTHHVIDDNGNRTGETYFVAHEDIDCEEIAEVTADYTGGGIYFYIGKFADGTYFTAADDWEGIFTLRTRTYDWEEDDGVNDDCIIGEFFNKDIFIKMLQKIVDEQPKGNYDVYEIKERLDYLTGLDEWY